MSKIQPGNRTANLTNMGKGRPKGSVNKTTASAKSMIEQAAQGLGGSDRLLAWAQEDPDNEKAFWTTIFPKLMPLQVHGPGEKGEHLVKAVEWIIAPRPADNNT